MSTDTKRETAERLLVERLEELGQEVEKLPGGVRAKELVNMIRVGLLTLEGIRSDPSSGDEERMAAKLVAEQMDIVEYP